LIRDFHRYLDALGFADEIAAVKALMERRTGFHGI